MQTNTNMFKALSLVDHCIPFTNPRESAFIIKCSTYSATMNKINQNVNYTANNVNNNHMYPFLVSISSYN